MQILRHPAPTGRRISTLPPESRGRLSGTMLKSAGKIGRGSEAKLGGDMRNGKLRLAEKQPRLVDQPVVQEVRGRPPAGLVADAGEMGGRHAELAGEVGDPLAGAEIALEHVGIAAGEAERGAGFAAVIACRGDMALEPDLEESEVKLRRPVRAGLAAFQLPLDVVDQA